MVPKKRKGRGGARQQGPGKTSSQDSQTSHNADSADDDYPAVMTSLVGAGEGREEMGGDTIADHMEDPEDEDEDEFEVASLYPASQLLCGAMSTYRSGSGHFVTGDSRAMTSDL